TLKRSGVYDVWISRIHRNIGDTCVFADFENVRPGFPAIIGSEQSALTAIGPERTNRRDVHDVWICRVDYDATDVLGGFESHVRPRLAAVLGLVDSVAPRGAALVVRLSCSNPDDFRIRWRER